MTTDLLTGLLETQGSGYSERKPFPGLLEELPLEIFGRMSAFLLSSDHGNLPLVSRRIPSAKEAIEGGIQEELRQVIDFFKEPSNGLLAQLGSLQKDVHEILKQLTLGNQAHVENRLQMRLLQFLRSLEEEEFRPLAHSGLSLRYLHFADAMQSAQSLRQILSRIPQQDASASWALLAKEVQSLQQKLTREKGVVGFGIAVQFTQAMKEEVAKATRRGFRQAHGLPSPTVLWDFLKSYLKPSTQSPVSLHRIIDKIGDLILDEKERDYWFQWIVQYLNNNQRSCGAFHALEKISHPNIGLQLRPALQSTQPKQCLIS